MNETVYEENNGDDAEFATKGDIRAVRAEMAAMKKEIMDHFDAVYENTVDQLNGVNRAEIDLHQNKIAEHEERLQETERTLGLRA